MKILTADNLPALPLTLVNLFARRRGGLRAPSDMPIIERSVSSAHIEAHWLCAYQDIVGLPVDAQAALPPLAPQIALAPLHLSLLSDAKFPFKALGIVHLSQRIEQWQPLFAGDEFDVRVFTTSARWEKRGMSFGLVTEITVGGKKVWRGETRALARVPVPASASKVQHGSGEVADAEIDPGTLIERIDLPENMGRRYSSVSGDRNPIHQHALLAKPFGFKRAIVHGTWTLARALAAAGLPRRPRFVMEANFRRPVELPSEFDIWHSREKTPARDLVTVKSPSGKTHLDVVVSGR
jgi:acyl dehydratase